MPVLLSQASRRGSNPAQLNLAGAISNGSSWIETLTLIDQDGNQVTGVGSDTFELQIRRFERDVSPCVTLSTGGELTVAVGATTTLAIDCPQSTISNLYGQYIVDIVSKSSGGDLTHRAHGILNFVNSPVAF